MRNKKLIKKIIKAEALATILDKNALLEEVVTNFKKRGEANGYKIDFVTIERRDDKVFVTLESRSLIMCSTIENNMFKYLCGAENIFKKVIGWI